MPCSNTLFRFLPAQWALKTLSERRLRVSRIAELNDPFEWRIGSPGETPEQAARGRQVFDGFAQTINTKLGIISMSAVATDPVIWAHYADSHKGMAFEFDHYRVSGLHAIVYSHALPMFDVTRFIDEGVDNEPVFHVLLAALCRKSTTWAYEREYRVHLELSECDEEDGHYFTPIPENFLKRVILGIRCETTKAEVEKALAGGGFSCVEVVQARMSDTSYEILWGGAPESSHEKGV